MVPHTGTNTNANANANANANVDADADVDVTHNATLSRTTERTFFLCFYTYTQKERHRSAC